MQELVKDLIQHKLTRRGFLSSMAVAGYSAGAARSALASVSPFVQESRAAEALTRTVTGTGGELLAEQLIEAGAQFMFVSNGSGLGPLCDALVTRPQIQFIQATHEGQVVAMADGYAKASGRIGFSMYSRVGLPHASSNMYNAMKDRSSLVLLSDHAETQREGTDSHEDLEDWLEAAKQYTKWRWVVHQAERIPEWVRQACKGPDRRTRARMGHRRGRRRAGRAAQTPGRESAGRRRVPLRADRLAVDDVALRPAGADGGLRQSQL